jgi:large subunit ribosomal protein L14e
MIFEVGRVCLKIAGRDANKYCAVVKVIDSKNVEIDGQTRRRKCNIEHLEPLEKILKIKENASNKEVCDALTKEGFETKVKEEKKEKVSKPKVVEKEVSEKKAVKKPAKKE